MKAGETTVLKLLQGSKVFLIPNFQRRYSWRAKEWELLWDDLIREYDIEHSDDSQSLDGHFLGSIVLHPAAGAASVLMQHLVIDGQQRLTTILILLAALRDVRSELDPTWDPKEYDHKYLTNAYDPDHPHRLLPTELDRDAYRKTLHERRPSEGIGQAYAFFAKKIHEVARAGSDLAKLGNTLLLHMLLVEINTSTGDSVNNIFNTLNSKGMPLTAADLVRNELLLHIGEDRSKEAYDQYWMPMEKVLVKEVAKGFDDRQFVTFLWSREVAKSANTTRQDLFATFERNLRKKLEGLPKVERQACALREFRAIYDDHRYFLLLRDPLNGAFETLGISAPLRESLERLRRWGSEPSVPLALWLLTESRRGGISQEEAVDAIELLLGYLMRRALAGIPTNQLNRLITPLAHRLATRDPSTSVTAELTQTLSLKGYHWPSDGEVLQAVVGQPLYISARRQVPFVLAEAERLLSNKEHAVTTGLTIEHVMPQTLSEEWRSALKAAGVEVDDALALLHTLGNLTLTGHNPALGNATFEDKKAVFGESPLHLNQDLAELDSLLPQDISRRSVELATLLLSEFPVPAEGPTVEPSAEDETAPLDKLEAALQCMPAGAWTTAEELGLYLGADLPQVHRYVNQLPAAIARLVRESEGTLPMWLNEALRAEVALQSNEELGALVSSERLGQLVAEVEQLSDGMIDDTNGLDSFDVTVIDSQA